MRRRAGLAYRRPLRRKPAGRNGPQRHRGLQGVDPVGMFDVCKHLAKPVGNPQEHAYDGASGRKLPVANQGKDVLKFQGKPLERGEPEEACDSFDRADRRESLANQFVVDVIASGFDGEKLVFDFRQAFATRDNEFFDGCFVVE
jgi:hypothetical protein